MRCAAVLIAAAEGPPVWRCLCAWQPGAKPDHQGRLHFPGRAKCAGHGHCTRGRSRQQVRNQRFLAAQPRNGSAPARVDFAGDVQTGLLTPGQDERTTVAGERHRMCAALVPSTKPSLFRDRRGPRGVPSRGPKLHRYPYCYADAVLLAKRNRTMTRSRYLLISLLSLTAIAPLSTGGLADGSASREFPVNAQAPGVCSVPSPQITWTAVNATFAGGAISITQFGGPNIDRAIASAISLAASRHALQLRHYALDSEQKWRPRADQGDDRGQQDGNISADCALHPSGDLGFSQSSARYQRFKRPSSVRSRSKQWPTIRQPDAELCHASELVASSLGLLS